MKPEQRRILREYLYMVKLIRKSIARMKWDDPQKKLDANDAEVALMEAERFLKSLVRK